MASLPDISRNAIRSVYEMKGATSLTKLGQSTSCVDWPYQTSISSSVRFVDKCSNVSISNNKNDGKFYDPINNLIVGFYKNIIYIGILPQDTVIEVSSFHSLPS